MDLVPKPGQVRAAAGNVAQLLVYGGLADLRPMPRDLLDRGAGREVHRYRPVHGVRESGDPVLLVSPLAAPARCYDLRRGCSLVEHLLARGRPTYLVEYGEVPFSDRGLTLDPWVEEVVPAAVRAVSEHAGGRPVHLVGWSLGGILAALVGADRPDLPIASLTLLGSPLDVSRVPMTAPAKPLTDLAELRLVDRGSRLLGGAPLPLVRWASRLGPVDRLVTRPLALATRLDDADFLAQVEAVDRFRERVVAFRGRSFGQLYHRFLRADQLLGGRVAVADRVVDLAAVRVPVLVFAGAEDTIAPAAAVRPVVPLLTGSPEVRFEIVPGGHLGQLTGRAARSSTWPVLDEWLADRDPAASPAAPRAH